MTSDKKVTVVHTNDGVSSAILQRGLSSANLQTALNVPAVPAPAPAAPAASSSTQSAPTTEGSGKK